MTRPVVFKLTSVIKQYNGREVLDIPNLEIRENEFFVVVGPSGAGKSTLLKLLDFLEQPDKGEVTYSGKLVSGSEAIMVRREVGLVFQRPEMLAGSVRDNVSYPLKLRGESSDGRVEKILEHLHLNALAETHTSQLSGGESQRVAFARVCITRPKVLLMDEPTANLDPYHVGLIEAMAQQMHENGATVILVTHNVFQARRLAKRVGLMLGGKMVEIGEVEDFFSKPNDPRAKEFVHGKMVY
ncbi:MAG: phosphate ABC transporter ATP-binding protein [Anaerolineae bacterium]|nr:phosphate ABC transporter ATP-binding protein [Anaerolineae bacterium]